MNQIVRVEFTELWVMLVLFLLLDLENHISRKWLLAGKISVLVALFIMIVGAFVMMYFQVFDYERYILCLNRDPDTLMDNGEWDLLYSLVKIMV